MPQRPICIPASLPALPRDLPASLLEDWAAHGPALRIVSRHSAAATAKRAVVALAEPLTVT